MCSEGQWGDLAYLNEPVSAFSVANYPGTAFRRAHTRTSSFHCAASCGERKRQVAAALADRRQAHPYLGPAATPPAGGRKQGRWRERELEMGTDGGVPWGPLTAYSAPFPMDPAKEASIPGLVQGREEGHLLLPHSLAHTPRNNQNVRSNGRAEGRSPRTVRQTQCSWSPSTALGVPYCVYAWFPARRRAQGLPLQPALRPPAPTAAHSRH